MNPPKRNMGKFYPLEEFGSTLDLSTESTKDGTMGVQISRDFHPETMGETIVTWICHIFDPPVLD